MKLLIRSTLRHLRAHLLQTVFTLAVTVLITVMLSVLFLFASSFQRSLRTYALEKHGTYHYKYYAEAGTHAAEALAEMDRRFQEDPWFSDVQLAEDGSQVYLLLTAAHPGLFTSKIMNQKYNAAWEACLEWREEEKYSYSDVRIRSSIFPGHNHNWELLASYGDLEKKNGIYNYLLVFLLLLAAVSAAAVLTLGSVFLVSAMQREREIALLAGIGADRGQIAAMILLESALYCLLSLPAGFGLGIQAYLGIQGHIDNIIYSLFRFPPADLVVSVPCSVALIVCAVCVILLSGLQSAARVSRISPMEALSRTTEIRIREKEGNVSPVPSGRNTVKIQTSERKNAGGNTAAMNAVYKNTAAKNAAAGNMAAPDATYKKAAAGPELWLAKKSWQRFKRRNRPILTMLAVTFALCFVLDGFRRYSSEVVRMTFDTIPYNFAVNLYSDDKAELNRLADLLKSMPDPASESISDSAQKSTIPQESISSPLQEPALTSKQTDISGNCLKPVREAFFSLQSPYPLSELGESSLLPKSGAMMLPDVVLQCVDEESFNRICGELGISEKADGLWGIFLNTERSWWSEGVKIKGKPYALAAGEKLRLYYTPYPAEADEEILLNIAGVYDKSPLYAEVTESARLQILVPDAVFSALESKGKHLESTLGSFHLSLRGNLEDGQAFAKRVLEQTKKVPGVTCRISDYAEEIRQEKAAIESFEFLCGSLVCMFVFVCICGNFTVSWAAARAREREFAALLSVGMKPVGLRKMRLFELTLNAGCAFLPGVLAGMCVYQIIYRLYTSEYRLTWRFPLTGLLLGTAALVFSVGVTDLALRLGSRKKILADQLRTE